MIDRSASKMARWVGLCALILAASPVFAQGAAPASPVPAAKSDWQFTLGGGVSISPKYEGSDRLALGGMPIAEIEWKERLFISSTRGIGGYIVSTDALKVSAAVGYAPGRDEKDGKPKSGKVNRLKGLGDIDGSAVVSLGAAYEFSMFTASLSANRYIGGSDGFTVTAGFGVAYPLTDKLGLGLEVNTTWADSAYMGDYFGINAAQSRRSGRKAYKAEAGLKDVGVTLSATYRLNDSITLMMSGGLSRLLGDAGSSPVVGEKNQPSAMLGLSYRF